MSYNRRNLLEKIVAIQNTTLEHTARGVTQEWVYRNIIFPKYFISKRTYYAYLGINAKLELKDIIELRHTQLAIEFEAQV